MPAIETLAQLVAGLAFMGVLGYPVVRLTMPEDLRSEYGHLLVYPVGYLMLCLGAFALSGSLHLPAETATLAACAVLAVAAAVLAARDRMAPAAMLGRVRMSAGRAAILVAPMFVVLLWPMLVDGSDTYLGAVNPDYFAGIVDNYFLAHGHSVADFTHGHDTHHPLDYMAGSISSSGRFASGLFGIALQALMRVDTRTALTLSIALFLLCLPLSMYFLAREVMGLDPRGARIASWLIGVSGPIGMSYIYFYVGQNSGLAALTLTLAAGYVLLMRPGPRLLVLFALLVNALLVVYLGMLPYALAPLGALGLYLLATRRLGVARLLALAAGFVLVSALVNFGMLASLYAMVRGWGNVIGQTLQGQYFLDFLTEAYFPIFLGVMAYPIKSSLLVMPAALAGALVSGCFILACIVRWTRAADPPRRVAVLSGVAIYAVVWWVYSFQRQYGYAVFKMSSWLQFVLVPFAAYGVAVALGPGPAGAGKRSRMLFAAAAAFFVATNIATTIEYGVKGLGRNPDLGYIANNFDMSGNRDYFDLAREVGSRVKPGESVGISFVDSIQNFWVAYYLRGTRMSLLSHENIPGDDENLPGIQTNRIVDYYGNVRLANNVFFHGASDDYYLTWNEHHINRDIAIPRFSTPPVWQDHTFRLYRAADNPGMTFTGRGFYRVEFSDGKQPWWWPDHFRWTAQGGEVYYLRPAAPGAGYRIVFDAVVGFELPNDSRTLELYANKVKFDELTVTSAGRYVSRPFTPAPDVTKIVIKVREHVKPGRRTLPLWNRDIPFDYRELNILLADIHVVRDGEAAPAPGAACVGALRGPAIQRCARSFDGLQIDGWVGRRARIDLPVAGPVASLRVTGSVPGNLGFAFPFAIRFMVDGQAVERKVAAPGAFALDLPVADGSRDGTLRLEIEPGEAREMKDEYRVRHKVVTQSVHLDSLEPR